ncbi:MAG: D-tyrosyl-tRNA(Tyr) deacylase [Clostridia bacterium]|nr:D-tyrosyl-tRNA(Tyr) deacylase [Clostridia bacterium]
MRAVLQITSKARLSCEGETVSDCGKGLCVLLGIEGSDTRAEADRIIDKILKMRIFQDDAGKLNLSPVQVEADILVVSNFTLYGNCKSRRPDFLRSMKYEPARELYQYVLEKMAAVADTLREEGKRGARVFPGVFGGDMKIDLSLDGPVTILLDTAEL